eukprot:COSAG05_NODE_22231_length_266_cov_0.622754_1_plen_71_part_01
MATRLHASSVASIITREGSSVWYLAEFVANGSIVPCKHTPSYTLDLYKSSLTASPPLTVTYSDLGTYVLTL